MKKGFIIILIMLLSMPFFAMADSPQNMTLKLRGAVPMQNVEGTMYDEENKALTGTSSELSFEFAPGVYEPITHAVTLKYSANLAVDTPFIISFDLTDLVFDANNKISTSMEMESLDAANVTVEDGNKSLRVKFLKGISENRDIGTIRITANNQGSTLLPTGEYEGSLTVRYTSAT